MAVQRWLADRQTEEMVAIQQMDDMTAARLRDKFGADLGVSDAAKSAYRHRPVARTYG